jgi:hypothetical protein
MSPRSVWSFLLGFLFLAALPGETFLATRAQAGQVPCTEILKAINRHVSRGQGRPVDLSELAEDMGTSVPWVEHCMRVYGRRSRRPGLESAEGREGLLEDYEENEPEEWAREDIEEPGARERPVRPQKPRYMQFKATPTPDLGYRRRLEGFD